MRTALAVRVVLLFWLGVLGFVLSVHFNLPLIIPVVLLLLLVFVIAGMIELEEHRR